MKQLKGEWTVVEDTSHVQLCIGKTCLLVDNGMSVYEALNTLLINAKKADLKGDEAE